MGVLFSQLEKCFFQLGKNISPLHRIYIIIDDQRFKTILRHHLFLNLHQQFTGASHRSIILYLDNNLPDK